MAEIELNHEDITIEGLYGDREVRLCHCAAPSPGGIDVVLLHGVHSSANLSTPNKFRILAELLTEKGFSAWLVETSRASRHMEDGCDHRQWVDIAFGGKTYAQEQEEVFRAIREVLRRNNGRPIWLWGFSLGGIIAAFAAAKIMLPDGNPAIKRLILGGTGLSITQRIEKEMMDMPILSTLRESISIDMLGEVRADEAISFRGEHDDIFSEKSCREFIGWMGVPDENKTFLTIADVDHSLRSCDGKINRSTMKEMVDFLAGQTYFASMIK